MAINKNLVGYYPLDINSDDYLGLNDGTDTAVTYSGGAAVYNGSTAFTALGNVLNFGTGDFTVAAWIKVASTPPSDPHQSDVSYGAKPIVHWKWTYPDTGWSLTLWHSDATYAIPNADIIQFHLANGTIGGPVETTIPGLSTWFHVAAVRYDDPFGAGYYMVLYLNGVAVHTLYIWTNMDVSAYTTNLQFGAGQEGPGYASSRFFDGSLKEVAFWDRAVTAPEVTAIYNAGVAGNPLSSLFPVAVVPDIAGAPAVPATFDGSGSTNVDYYHWSWDGVPTPFPDNQAATPIDMTDNEGLWHFDSSVTADTSGLGANFTATGSPTLSAPGKIGSNRVVFDGTSGLEVPLSGTSSTSGTISGWVNIGPAGFDGAKIIFGLEDGSTIGGWRALNVGGTGILNFYFYGGSIATAATLFASTWYHLVVSWQPDGGQDRVKVYVNGASVLNTLTGSLVTLPANTPFLVALHGTSGAWPYTPTYTPMEADELAVWSRVLSDTEVSGIYAAQNVGPLLVPSGSTVDNAPIPFPDNKATAPIDMTGNVALWHFEGNANDTSGDGNNGTVSGATQVAGKVGSNAYSFDGISDYIDVGSSFAYTTEDFSFSFWVQEGASQSGYVNIFGNQSGPWPNKGFCLENDSSGSHSYRIVTGDGSWTFGSAVTLTPGVWTHLAITRSGTMVSIYRDGVLAVSDNSFPTTITATTIPTYLGANQSFGNYWNGILDEFAIWERTLGAIEVFSIYKAQSGTIAGVGDSAFTFTPDIVGTYTAKLEVADSLATNTNADAVIAAGGGGGPPGQGGSLQGSTLQGGNLEGDI